MNEKKETFWLYYGERIIASVLLPVNATLPEIFAKAKDTIYLLGESYEKMPYLNSCLVYIYRDNKKILKTT